MEREDPLERIARQENERKSLGGGRNIVLFIIMAVLAAAAIVLGIMVATSKKEVKTTNEEKEKYAQLVVQLNEEKEDLTKQFEALQNDFATLSSDYDSINTQLDASRSQISQLVDQLKNTDATNRAKMRQYQSELGTLRSIMRGYISQIDSLNTLNHKLTEQAREAREEAASQSRRNEKLTAKVETLSSKVAVGSVIKARGLRIDAYNGRDKVTDRASKTKRMLVSLSLVANDLAEKGPVTVYVRVIAPDGSLLSDGRGTTFTVAGATAEATASREVDYEGEEVDMSIFVNNLSDVQSGTYQMEAFTSSGKLGSAALTLR